MFIPQIIDQYKAKNIGFDTPPYDTKLKKSFAGWKLFIRSSPVEIQVRCYTSHGFFEAWKTLRWWSHWSHPLRRRKASDSRRISGPTKMGPEDMWSWWIFWEMGKNWRRKWEGLWKSWIQLGKSSGSKTRRIGMSPPKFGEFGQKKWRSCWNIHQQNDGQFWGM